MLLSQKEQKKLLLLHGKSFVAKCDEKDCDRLIEVDKLYVVKKWGKRPDNDPKFLGKLPERIRCIECDNEKHPKRMKYVEKRSKKEETEHDMPAAIKRRVLKIFKKDPTPLSTEALLVKIYKKKELRDYKKNKIKRVLKLMKQVDLIRRRKKMWQLPPEKKEKDNADTSRGKKSGG